MIGAKYFILISSVVVCVAFGVSVHMSSTAKECGDTHFTWLPMATGNKCSRFLITPPPPPPPKRKQNKTKRKTRNKNPNHTVKDNNLYLQWPTDAYQTVIRTAPFELAVKEKCETYHDWALVEQMRISLQSHFSYMGPGYDAGYCVTINCFGSRIYPATSRLLVHTSQVTFLLWVEGCMHLSNALCNIR